MFHICAIAKNEGLYLAEWLEYHLMIGVDRIIVYNNGSEDDTRELCTLYPEVELVNWPTRVDQQKRAYQDYLRRYRDGVDWVAFIDIDEFICYRGTSSLEEYLRAVPPHCAGLELPWVSFDSCDHKKRPAGLVVENYTRAHSVAPQQNVKSICRPAAVRSEMIDSPHRFSYQPGLSPVCTDIKELCIFHYTLRSYEDVRAKVLRGDAWCKETERKRLANVDQAIHSILTKYDNADTTETHMLRHVDELKKRLLIRQQNYTFAVSDGESADNLKSLP
jgi:hypothetical protein